MTGCYSSTSCRTASAAGCGRPVGAQGRNFRRRRDAPVAAIVWTAWRWREHLQRPGDVEDEPHLWIIGMNHEQVDLPLGGASMGPDEFAEAVTVQERDIGKINLDPVHAGVLQRPVDAARDLLATRQIQLTTQEDCDSSTVCQS